MAPSANIVYYGSRSCDNGDLSDTLAKVVNQNKASLVTNSWGSAGETAGTDEVAADEQIFLQGALQGIGFLFSSGDSGDELAKTGIRQPDYPASDPYVTAVGGTSDAIGGDGTFAFQTGWGTEKYTENADHKGWTNIGFTSGAGGGESSMFGRPAYQQGVVPNSFGSGRAVPDVGLDADPTTGFLVGQTQTFPDGVYYDEYRIGGTSLASPLYAGMTALTTENAGGRLGFLNPAIYAQAGSGTFTDVKGSPPDEGNVRADFANSTDDSAGIVYSVRALGRDSSLALGTGWDEVTGIGSPNPGWLTSIKQK
jgi:subtilase family serine protease